MTDEETRLKAQRGRNIAMAVSLALFVVLVFVVSLVRMGGNIVSRPF